MKATGVGSWIWVVLVAVMMLTLGLSAQEKETKPEEATSARHAKPLTVKVSVTFVEFEGEKKVKSLPYTLVVVTEEQPSKVRMGSRVPIYTGKENGMQYVDVGSNIDCQATRTADGAYDLRLSLDRSWVEGDVPVTVEKSSSSSPIGQFPEPVIRQFRSDLKLILREGQMLESSFATDPLSGKVFKVEVTLNLVK
jgi:hypothetical protein